MVSNQQNLLKIAPEEREIVLEAKMLSFLKTKKHWFWNPTHYSQAECIELLSAITDLQSVVQYYLSSPVDLLGLDPARAL